MENIQEAQTAQQELEQHFTQSIQGEIDFLGRHTEMSPEKQEYYLAESEWGFLDEFAGAIKNKCFTYELRGDGLYFADMRVMDSYQYAAREAGYGSRTWHETEGMHNMQEMLLQGDAAATIFSPPKIADYGFVFHAVRGEAHAAFEGDIVQMHIVEYPEEQRALENTHTVADAFVGDEASTHFTTNDYLSRPFGHSTVESSDDMLHRLYAAVDVSQEDMVKSQLFQEQTRKELGSMVAEYARGVRMLASGEIDVVDRKLLEHELMTVKRELYTRACSIRATIDTVVSRQAEEFALVESTVSPSSPLYLDQMSSAYHEYAPPMDIVVDTSYVQPLRASDCVSSQSSTEMVGSTSMSVNTLSAGVREGLTLNQIIAAESAVTVGQEKSCPEIKCGKSGCNWKAKDSDFDANKKLKHTSCPKCGWKP